MAPMAKVAPSKREAIELAAVLAWQTAKDALESAKASEAELRAAAIVAVWPGGLPIGTSSRELVDGSTLKAEVRASAKVDQQLIGPAVAKLQKLGPVGKLLAERLVKWKAEASVREFKTLTDDQRRLVEDAITVAPGSPSLELVIPAR